MKPNAIRMIGSGVISAIYASRLRNTRISASFCVRRDYIRLENAGKGPACRSVCRGAVNHGEWSLISRVKTIVRFGASSPIGRVVSHRLQSADARPSRLLDPDPSLNPEPVIRCPYAAR